jgi:hypothetical protein
LVINIDEICMSTVIEEYEIRIISFAIYYILLNHTTCWLLNQQVMKLSNAYECDHPLYYY